MADQNITRPKLKIIQGGLHCTCGFGNICIHASPENSQPFPVDAIVYEEDTWLTISAEPEVSGPLEHPIRLMTELIEVSPEPVGSVVIKGNHPLQFLAVVHDVDQEPTWKEEWVKEALLEVFRLSEDRKISAIGLPLLGTLHGKIERKRFTEIFGELLRKQSIHYLKKIWLMAPVKVNEKVIQTLESYFKTPFQVR